MGGVDLKTKGKTVRASRRKSSSDERSRWKFFSSRELLFAESPPFFFPPFFVSTAFTDEREREREREWATTTRLNENWPRLSTGDQHGE